MSHNINFDQLIADINAGQEMVRGIKTTISEPLKQIADIEKEIDKYKKIIKTYMEENNLSELDLKKAKIFLSLITPNAYNKMTIKPKL